MTGAREQSFDKATQRCVFSTEVGELLVDTMGELFDRLVRTLGLEVLLQRAAGADVRAAERGMMAGAVAAALQMSFKVFAAERSRNLAECAGDEGERARVKMAREILVLNAFLAAVGVEAPVVQAVWTVDDEIVDLVTESEVRTH